MSGLYRVIICGPRDWPDREQVELFISGLDISYSDTSYDGIQVVHGDYETGVDRFAREYCERAGIDHEPHPADWTKLGPAAGPIRNRGMAESGANLCAAFWDGRDRKGREPGTLNMVRQALHHGIRVEVLPPRKMGGKADV